MRTALQHFHSTGDFPDSLKGGTVIPGNFDGWHLGHRQLCKLARIKIGLPIVILTFEPHPRQFFAPAPASPPFRLTSQAQKAAAIAETPEVAALVTLEFNQSLAAMEAQDFVQKILCEALGARHCIVGYDFRFGKGRSGTADTISAVIPTTVIDAHTDKHGDIISSSHIRKLIGAGKISEAAGYLGRSYAIGGIVQNGDRLGKQLGFPTANIAPADHLRPLCGVYISRTFVQGKHYDSITNYGFRPTVDGSKERFETHIFDFDADIYGQHAEVSLLSLLRAEKKFADIDALKAQIAEDCTAAKAYFTKTASA